VRPGADAQDAVDHEHADRRENRQVSQPLLITDALAEQQRREDKQNGST